jgi:uncharacterized protein YbjT (DUF2867 family)
MKTALIAGASGLIGSELVKILTESKEYKTIYILTRKSLKLESHKIIEHIINFDELVDLKLKSPIDHIFCTLGTTIKKAGTKENFRKVDFDYVVNLGKLAKEIHVEKFMVVSSLGANVRSMIFYSRVKGEVEEALKKLSLPHLFIFRPSLLLGNRAEHRAGEKTAASVYKVLSPFFSGPLKKYKGVEAIKVANAMMQMALQNEEHFKILESDKIQKF